MLEALKIAYEFVKRHFREIEAHSRIIKLAHRFSQICLFALRRFVIFHPIFVFSVLAIGAGWYLFYNPEIVGRDKCYLEIVKYDALVQSDAQRDCQTGRLIALAWDNFPPYQDLNRGSLLVNDATLASTEENKDIWSEIYIPTIKPERPSTSLYGLHPVWLTPA